MDNNLLTAFSAILTAAGTILSYFLTQLVKKHSNSKDLDTLYTLASQAVAWAEKNFTSNPDKLKNAIDYVTKEAKNLKAEFTPAQIEAQIEATYASFKKDLASNPIQTISGVTNTVKDVAKTASNTIEKVSETPAAKEIEQAVPEVASVAQTAQTAISDAEQIANLIQPIINGTEGLALK